MSKHLFAVIPAGPFQMGADSSCNPEDGEGPLREVYVSSFQMSTTAVSIGDFRSFVEDTGYETTAERDGFSLIFAGELDDPDEFALADPVVPWWRKVPGTNWRRPLGSGDNLMLPVVHVSFEDALAYSSWSGTRIPTEAEWEKAADVGPGPDPHIWKGEFPDRPFGPVGPLSVESGMPNTFGLYHMCGNTWEWAADRFARLHGTRPTRDPKGPLNGSNRVVKGGSFLCSPSYCARFKPWSRRAEHPMTTTSHTGFRVAKDR